MQTISERKELRSAVEKWKTSRAPHSGLVPNKAAISGRDDIASVNQRQTNEGSAKDADRVASPAFAAALVVVLVILYAAAWFARSL